MEKNANQAISNHLKKKCKSIETRREKRWVLVAAIAGGGVLIGGGAVVAGVVIYHQNEKIKQAEQDIAKTAADSAKFQQDMTLALFHSIEKHRLTTYYNSVEKEIVSTIDEIFEGTYDWKNYEERNLLPFIDGDTFVINNKPTACDENNTIKVTHTVFGGTDLATYNVFKVIYFLIRNHVFKPRYYSFIPLERYKMKHILNQF